MQKKIADFLYFFYQSFHERENPYADSMNCSVPNREGIFCYLRREKCSSYCRVIFSLLLNVNFPIPLFPIIFTRKLLEDSWLVTGASGRVARKFGR